MNLVILVSSAQMFLRNLGLRQINETLSSATRLAALNAGQKIIVRFERIAEWVQSERLATCHMPVTGCGAALPTGSTTKSRQVDDDLDEDGTYDLQPLFNSP